MHDVTLSRRTLVKTTLAGAAMLRATRRAPALAAPTEMPVPDGWPVERFDFETAGVDGWTVVDGQWAVEDMAGAPSGRRVLVQRATKNAFNVIVAPAGPYTDVEVTMSFKPMSGREDASGGIVVRFSDGKYYVVRANALEDNFNLYAYEGSRRQLAGARVKAPTLGRWHRVRLLALGDHMQAWLNGTLLLDHRAARFAAGRVGLWTKADSITAFDDLTIRGVARSAGRMSWRSRG
jgi:Domain of Unknown Function (DUF1080)